MCEGKKEKVKKAGAPDSEETGAERETTGSARFETSWLVWASLFACRVAF
jgi:hypothetical protein